MSLKIDSTVLELLASRICHDIISPVGAIRNGLELLEDMGADGANDAIQLVNGSAASAAAKLQMFRLAYGAGGKDETIKVDDVHKAFGNLIAEGKVKQDWNSASISRDDMKVGFCKMLACTLMLAQECLPKGGVIKVAQNGPKSVTVTAEGVNAAPRESVADAIALKLQPETLDPRLVHPYVIGVLAKQYGYGIVIDAGAQGKVALSLTAV